MKRQTQVNLALIFGTLSFLSSLVAIGGGGLDLPPFKTFPWLSTSTSTIGVYGACLKDGIDTSLFTFDPSWLQVQNSNCKNLFLGSSASPETLFGRSNMILILVNVRDEIMVSGIAALSIFLAILCLSTLNAKSPITGTIYGFGSSILQALAFGMATYQLRMIWIDLSNGTYQNSPITADPSVQIGYGLYLSGASLILNLISTCFGWAAVRSKKSEDFVPWTV